MSQRFQHNLPNVEDYLHHRSPYLLVSEIGRIEAEAIQTSTLITGDDFRELPSFPAP
jgi:3-hydroxyacyl-[acyl-carrier-protein] dehydratase